MGIGFAMNLNFKTHDFSSAVHSLFANRWLPLVIFLSLMAIYFSFFFFLGGVTQTEGSIPPDQLTTATDSKFELSYEPEIVKKEITGTIKKGDTITALLGNYLSTKQILQMAQQSKKIFPFSNLRSGQPYKLFLVDDQFDSFIYDIDSNEQLLIHQNENEFKISRILIQYDVTTDVVKGAIISNLFDAVSKAGEEAELAINLADIFAWDIDFILDIREGDSFQVVVEKRFREGQPAGYGRILAAEFVNQGKSFQAILFSDGNGNIDYYDIEGRNLRKAFLKAPLAFTRISSGFTMKRFHPITKTWKAHPAIDYVAPVGTPIKTVGDGKVIRIGYTRGNGNFIEIRHTNGYSTLYLHMSKFAKGIKKGKRVDQGQVIGYVGSTGLATGPHLCFRMRKDGAPVNPNKVKMPSAPAVSSENMAQFHTLAEHMLARLKDNKIFQAMLDSPAEIAKY
jgi:murein DD-endopeptidase MepM/ murein hydrolase activator NlpD